MATAGGHQHEIEKNLRSTRIFIAANIAVLGGTGAMLGIPFGLFWMLLLPLVFIAGAAAFAWYSVSHTAQLTTAFPARDHYPDLNRAVDHISLAAGIPPPMLYVIERDDLNSFAWGLHPTDSNIAITTGMLQELTPTELNGVIAHEIAHIANRDTLVMTLSYACLNFLTNIRNIVLYVCKRLLHYIAKYSQEKFSQQLLFFFCCGAVLIAFVAILILIAPGAFISWLFTLATSRDRETLADATTTHYLMSPIPLRKALERISQSPYVPLPVGIDAMLIHRKSPHFFLGATHPPIQWRINQLRQFEGMPVGSWPDPVSFRQRVRRQSS